jgi:hypothetical protein
LEAPVLLWTGQPGQHSVVSYARIKQNPDTLPYSRLFLRRSVLAKFLGLDAVYLLSHIHHTMIPALIHYQIKSHFLPESVGVYTHALSPKIVVDPVRDSAPGTRVPFHVDNWDPAQTI